MLSRINPTGRLFHSQGILSRLAEKISQIGGEAEGCRNGKIGRLLPGQADSRLQVSLQQYRGKKDWTEIKQSYSSAATPEYADRKLAGVKCNDEEGMLEVEKANRGIHKFPYVWLRDNCQCEECHHPISHARNLFMKDLDLNVKPVNIDVLTGPEEVVIEWSDNHVSQYDLSWLLDRNFSEENQRLHMEATIRTHNYRQKNELKRLKFDDIMNNEETLFEWITELEVNGICLVTDATAKADQIDVLANRVAFMRKTAIGTVQSVKAAKEANNPTYTSATLPLHTDHPYYFMVPGLQMIHCRSNTREGGDSIFADGFYAAEYMREHYPDLFHDLSTIPINYCDLGKHFYKFDKLTHHTMFGVDRNGELEHIVFSNGRRDSRMTAPIDKVQRLYQGMKIFNEIIHDTDNMIQIKLQPGEIMIWNNRRYLHGRVGFTMTENDERHLETGYIDWDEMRSRRRVIAKELGLKL